MKICLYTENYYKGGLDTFIINLINSWPNTYDLFTLVINEDHPGLNDIKSKVIRNIKIITYKSYYFKFLSILNKSSEKKALSIIFRSMHFIFQFPLIMPFKLVFLTNFFYSLDSNRLMVINGGYPASLNCRLSTLAWQISGKKVNAILNFHSEAQKSSLYNSFFENILDFFVLFATKKVIGVSKFCIKSLNQRMLFRHSDGSKFHHIYNGIQDLNSMLDTKKNSKEKYCIMLATYSSYKGHDFLFQAFKEVIKKHPDYILKIYGYGTRVEINQVKNILRKSGISKNVSLNPFTKDIASLIKKATVLLVPSQSFEAFGLTIIEAMCLGTPVVATNIGGIPEVIGNSGAGIICPHDNPKIFAEAISYLIKNPKICSVMANKGRISYLKKFNSAIMSYSYWKILR
jgi:glycosyltransferase involved in cell wall biosynthesis